MVPFSASESVFRLDRYLHAGKLQSSCLFRQVSQCGEKFLKNVRLFVNKGNGNMNLFFLSTPTNH